MLADPNILPDWLRNPDGYVPANSSEVLAIRFSHSPSSTAGSPRHTAMRSVSVLKQLPSHLLHSSLPEVSSVIEVENQRGDYLSDAPGDMLHIWLRSIPDVESNPSEFAKKIVELRCLESLLDPTLFDIEWKRRDYRQAVCLFFFLPFFLVFPVFLKVYITSICTDKF